jgi:hypothetical protein
MTNKIPAAAVGSYTVSIEASNTVTLLPGTVIATPAVDAAKPVEFYFSVDKSAVVARRQVVDPPPSARPAMPIWASSTAALAPTPRSASSATILP